MASGIPTLDELDDALAVVARCGANESLRARLATLRTDHGQRLHAMTKAQHTTQRFVVRVWNMRPVQISQEASSMLHPTQPHVRPTFIEIGGLRFADATATDVNVNHAEYTAIKAHRDLIVEDL